MTRKIQVHQVDAFTREPFTGNPTGVVLNADLLSEAQMLAIARELNNAETAFILAPDAVVPRARARGVTPRRDTPPPAKRSAQPPLPSARTWALEISTVPL